jgi:hypothetical protein
VPPFEVHRHDKGDRIVSELILAVIEKGRTAPKSELSAAVRGRVRDIAAVSRSIEGERSPRCTVTHEGREGI